MVVHRPRISGIKLGLSGGRCWMTTKAIPLSAGVALKKVESASRPPAEAPTPTIGKERLARCSDPTGAAGSVCEFAVATCSAGLGVSLVKDPPLSASQRRARIVRASVLDADYRWNVQVPRKIRPPYDNGMPAELPLQRTAKGV
jgi:hypothetical protein